MPLVIGTPIAGEERLLRRDTAFAFIDPDRDALPG